MYIISIYCGSKFPQTLNFCKIEDTDQGAEVTVEPSFLQCFWLSYGQKENI